MKSVFGPVKVPLAIGAQSAELAHGMDIAGGPPSAGFLDARLDDVAVAALDEAGADG